MIEKRIAVLLAVSMTEELVSPHARKTQLSFWRDCSPSVGCYTFPELLVDQRHYVRICQEGLGSYIARQNEQLNLSSSVPVLCVDAVVQLLYRPCWEETMNYELWTTNLPSIAVNDMYTRLYASGCVSWVANGQGNHSCSDADISAHV